MIGKKILIYILLSLVAVVMTSPFLWLTLTAFKGSGEVYTLSFEWSDLTLKNFPYVWKHGNIAQYFRNSVWIAIWQVLANVILCSLAAYPLARYKFPGQKTIFVTIISTMMIPMHLIMIPLFTICIFFAFAKYSCRCDPSGSCGCVRDISYAAGFYDNPERLGGCRQNRWFKRDRYFI